MKIVRFFPDADMRMGHLGLFKQALKEGVDLNKLGHGEFVIFVNRRRKMLKMFASKELIAHLKLEEGVIDDSTIQFIPGCFDGGRIDYARAVYRAVRDKNPKYFGGT